MVQGLYVRPLNCRSSDVVEAIDQQRWKMPKSAVETSAPQLDGHCTQSESLIYQRAVGVVMKQYRLCKVKK